MRLAGRRLPPPRHCRLGDPASPSRSPCRRSVPNSLRERRYPGMQQYQDAGLETNLPADHQVNQGSACAGRPACRRGDPCQAVPLPRRMWAGARFEFHRPLHIGEAIVRKSTIADVSTKDSRVGPLIFVLVRHEITGPAGVALVEEHDIVYREAPSSSEVVPQPPAAPTGAVWLRDIHADEVMLFRYSALIFVGHRIHYDRRYATEVEGYPGLVVHGPLIATLLADLLRRHSSAPLKSLRFRAISPLFDNAPFAVCGMPEPDGRASLWAQNAEGALAMKAEAVMHSA